jgi:hypothetical protein
MTGARRATRNLRPDGESGRSMFQRRRTARRLRLAARILLAIGRY